MPETFAYDVFLSHTAKDKPAVREIAERLKKDGLKVWFDEWEMPAKIAKETRKKRIKEGLIQSRILVLCLSKHITDADWAQVESGSFRHDDQLDMDKRLILVRLDNAPIKASAKRLFSIVWSSAKKDQNYTRLREACKADKPEVVQVLSASQQMLLEKIHSLGHSGWVRSVAWSPDGTRALSGAEDNTVRIWDVVSGRCLRVLEGHSHFVMCVAWSPDGKWALSGAMDRTVRIWEVKSGSCIDILAGHTSYVTSVAWSKDGSRVISGGHDFSVRLWDVATGRCLCVWDGHTDSVLSVAWSPDGRHALSGGADKTVRLWEVDSGNCLRVLEGHTSYVKCVAWSPNGGRALSAAEDNTIMLWDVEGRRRLRTLKGHTSSVLCVAWSPDGSNALSGSANGTLRFWEVNSGRCLNVLKEHTSGISSVAWSLDGQFALSAAGDRTVRLWEAVSWACIRVLDGHTKPVRHVEWSADGSRALSGACDATVRLWEVESMRCLKVFEDHDDSVNSVAWSSDSRHALSGSDDDTVRLWDLESGHCLCVLEGHTSSVYCVAWSADGSLALSGAGDDTARVWDVKSGRCIFLLEGHANAVTSLAWSPNGNQALTGSGDDTVRLWDVKSGRCIRVLEGHTNAVTSLACSPDGLRALSGGADKTIRLWDLKNGRCVSVLRGHSSAITTLKWHSKGDRAFSGALDGVWLSWELAKTTVGSQVPSMDIVAGELEQVQYTNAKVLLVGESGVGKTGLSNYLACNVKVEEERPLPSTNGAWATQWTLKHVQKEDGVEREIWLWDFAGQVDYRLVHQLFMDETAAAVLVFNPQKEDLFEGLGRWHRDLQKASRKPFAKLLAAARIDRGGLVVSSASVRRFMDERGFIGPLYETSAKTGVGCDSLRDAIVGVIDWDAIPKTNSPALYRRLKQEILGFRDGGLVLIRWTELEKRLESVLGKKTFESEELNAVITLLAGPGMIMKLDFGGFVLLRPEVLSRYAAAVVRTVRGHPQELGCISEEDFLGGRLDYQDFKRLPYEDESVVLRALLETFVYRAWCLRQPCDTGTVLTFPSYFRRERLEQPNHPNVLVTYRFTGPVDEIYATLVVRLHHTATFDSTDLWKSAADFKTQTGKKLGFTLTLETEGTSRLEVYFEPEVDENSRVVFLGYVQKHLEQQAQNMERLRHFCCGNKKCYSYNVQFKDQPKIDKALAPGGKGKIFCPDCGRPINLRDMLEERFHSADVKEQVRVMQVESQSAIDNESKELILVGHAYAIIAEAGQIYRGYTNSDHGIDGEIEFKDDNGRATGKRLYLQLKSGDSYVNKRKGDGVEIFKISEPRWAEYWQQQAYPVMLVNRTSDGEIRWMDATEYLMRHSTEGKAVRQIELTGERFDVMSVRRWRDKVLGKLV